IGADTHVLLSLTSPQVSVLHHLPVSSRCFSTSPSFFFFFFNDTPTTKIYTLSLHDALPISASRARTSCPARTSSRTRNRQIPGGDRKSTRLNSSHVAISYAVFCLKKKK